MVPSESVAASSVQAADFYWLLAALSIEDTIEGSAKRMRSMASSSESGHSRFRC
jgi:uncharacterized protein YjfI (DUF2170 family)